MEDIGMTDKQFNGFLRLLIGQLSEISKEIDPEEKSQKLKKVINNLQATLED